jgi:hypothetical protein
LIITMLRGIGDGDPFATLLEDLGGEIQLRRRLLLGGDVDDGSRNRRARPGHRASR